jgi:prevent-host-death family protein
VKFVSSREIRVNPKPIFDSLEKDREVIVTSRGKPVALLLGVTGDDLEETVRLVRRARAQAAVSRIRKAASQAGLDGMSRAEIGEEIAAARSERSRQ